MKALKYALLSISVTFISVGDVSAKSSVSKMAYRLPSASVSDTLVRIMLVDSVVAVQKRKWKTAQDKLIASTSELNRLKRLNDQKINELRLIERNKTAQSSEYKSKLEEIIKVGQDMDRLSKTKSIVDLRDRNLKFENLEGFKDLNFKSLRDKVLDFSKRMDLKKLKSETLDSLLKEKSWDEITLGEAQESAGNLVKKLKDKWKNSGLNVQKTKSVLPKEQQEKLDQLDKEKMELDKRRSEIDKKRSEILKSNKLDSGGWERELIKSLDGLVSEKPTVIFHGDKVYSGADGVTDFYIDGVKVSQEEYKNFDATKIKKSYNSIVSGGVTHKVKKELLTK